MKTGGFFNIGLAMAESVSINVIVVSWNVRELLRRCLRSLETSEVQANVLVVDNASSDGSAEMVRREFPGLRCIANNTNRGFAAAVNQGLAECLSGDVLLLNPDAAVSQSTLKRCLDRLHAEPTVGILGCRLRNSNGSTQGSVRRFPRLIDQALILLKLHRVFPRAAAIRSYFMVDFNYDQESDVDQVKGAFFLIRRSVISAIGKLDERFWIWFEEVDYCWRARQSGFRVLYYPGAEVTHAQGESFRSVWTVRRQIVFTASLIAYFKKYQPGWRVAILEILRPFSLFLAVLASPISLVRAKILTPNG